MEDFYEWIKAVKAENRLKNKELGDIIGMDGEAFRMAVTRQSLSDLQKSAIKKNFEESNNIKMLGNQELIELCRDGSPDNRKVASYVINHFEELLQIEEMRIFHENIELKAMIRALQEVKQR